MSQYNNLVNAWNNALVSLPANTSGSLFIGGDTTAQKLAKVNAWTVTGTVPTTLFVTGDQILNCINFPEFNQLQTYQQANILSLCHVPGQLLGGSATTSHAVAGMIINYFSNLAGPTVTALTALAKATVTPWWQVDQSLGGGGFFQPITLADVAAAGLS